MTVSSVWLEGGEKIEKAVSGGEVTVGAIVIKGRPKEGFIIMTEFRWDKLAFVRDNDFEVSKVKVLIFYQEHASFAAIWRRVMDVVWVVLKANKLCEVVFIGWV